MKKDKRQRKIKTKTGLGILALVIAIGVIALGYLTYRAVKVVQLSKQVDVQVDGSQKYKTVSSKKLWKQYETSDPADIITGNPDAKKQETAIVFAGLSESSETNEKILDYLKQAKIQATFAIPAARARENDGFIKELKKSGQKLAGNGLTGTETASLSAASLLGKLNLAQKTLGQESRQQVKQLYLPISNLSFFKMAQATGYEQVIVPKDSDLLDRTSFKTKTAVSTYVSHLTGQRIILVNLAQVKQPVHQEPTIVAAKPALDKQAILNDQKSTKNQELDVDQLTKDLLASLKKQKIPVVPLNQLGKKSLAEYMQDLLQKPAYAPVYRYSLTRKKEIAPVFRDVATAKQYQAIKKALKKDQATGSFFVDSQTPLSLVKQIKQDGYGVEISSQTGLLTKMTAWKYLSDNQERLTKEGISPKAYLLGKNDQVKAVRAAAYEADLIPVKAQTGNSKLESGYYYEFSGEKWDQNSKKKLDAFLQKAKKEKYQTVKISSLLSSQKIKSLPSRQIQTLRKQNNGKKSSYQKMVLTTEPALSLLFSNLSHGAADLDVGRIVKSRGGQATFAATYSELVDQNQEIETLLEEGHELALVYQPSSAFPATFKGTVDYLHNCLAYAKWRYDYQPKLVFLAPKNAKKGVLEAIKAEGMQAIGASQSLIKAKTNDSSDKTIKKNMTGISKIRFTRGGIEQINLGYYDQDEGASDGSSTVMGSMVKSILKAKLDAIAYHPNGKKKLAKASEYQLKNVTSLLNSKDKYAFNSKKSDLVLAGKNNLAKLHPYWKQFAYIQRHYLGSNFITSPVKMPGFDYWETNRLDQVGRLTNKKVLFLTFDDWGTDQSINKLLYVLKKHRVKATFFVLTQNVQNNSNLLRSIAEDGHEVASHSDSHTPLAIANKSYTRYHSLSKKQVKSIRKDLARSYAKLNKYVGDVKVDGKKALSLDFRPPTLEVSKNGLETVFNVGFKYAISGDVSTNDYEQKSFASLLNALKNGSPSSADDYQVTNGSVIVMHMLENAKYTAQVLDVMIPIWQKEGYKFATIDQYTKAYSQNWGK